MLFALAFVFYVVTVVCRSTAPAGESSARDSGDHNDFELLASPIATAANGYYIVNFRTSLYLQHSIDPGDTGYLVRAVSYPASADSTVLWALEEIKTPVGLLRAIHANRTGESGIFVNAEEGQVPAVRTLATPFVIAKTKPFTYTVTLPLTTLALTAPDTAGAPVTLQEFEEGNLAQSWHFL